MDAKYLNWCGRCGNPLVEGEKTDRIRGIGTVHFNCDLSAKSSERHSTKRVSDSDGRASLVEELGQMTTTQMVINS
jgi:hypothetical protein